MRFGDSIELRSICINVPFSMGVIYSIPWDAPPPFNSHEVPPILLSYLCLGNPYYKHIINLHFASLSQKTRKYKLYIFELVVSTHLKNMIVKLDHFPRDQDEHMKYLKPPPSFLLNMYSPKFNRWPLAELLRLHICRQTNHPKVTERAGEGCLYPRNLQGSDPRFRPRPKNLSIQ